MRFNSRLKPFKAISFDLDDTLYSNFPVMMATDAKMTQYFAQVLPPCIAGEYNQSYWLTYRNQALIDNPLLIHDVGDLRLRSCFLGIKALGFEDKQAIKLAHQALDYFVSQRSDFSVPNAVHQLLSALKAKWPLVAISNGNVDTQAIGLKDYFVDIYHAGQSLKQKPDTDMFDLACKNLAILPEQLLHVGDCGRSDIYGAVNAGCQTAWVSTYDVGKPITVLANIELTDVVELQRLL